MNESSKPIQETHSGVWRSTARRILPPGMRRWLRSVAQACRERQATRRLKQLRRRLLAAKTGTSATVQLSDFIVSFNNGYVCYYLYKDLFINGIYDFEAQRPDPLILDCGSNVGMSILRFKHTYPRARVIGFEPDPILFPYLQENVKKNDLRDVQLVQAAVSSEEGTLSFYVDGLVGSSLSQSASSSGPQELQEHTVQAVRLRDYLTEPVDFLKMNIEGAEWDVLQDSADRLHLVREMVVEYHHLPGLPRTLHNILTLLHNQGFEYAVSDFGVDSYAAKLPMTLNEDSRYFRHVYARRK